MWPLRSDAERVPGDSQVLSPVQPIGQSVIGVWSRADPFRSTRRYLFDVRIAALFDIHGNLPALEAVLQDVARAGVDRIVVGGDVVLGPMTRDALETLTSLSVPVHFIRGNAEIVLLDEIAGRALSFPVPEQYRPALRWEAEQLSEYAYMLEDWPRTLHLDVPALGSSLFCHATPRNENEIFVRTTPEAVLRPIFDPLAVSLVVCGHTHMQFDRLIGATRVVNAGSVGMPFMEAGAYWLLLDQTVTLKRTRYDLNGAAERIRATDYPRAEDYATNAVLHPPREATMLESFSRVELK